MDSHGCSQPKILNLKPFLSRPWCGLFGILHIQIQDVPRRSICFYWSPSEYGTGSTPTGPPLRSMHPRHPKCEPQKLTTTKACREPEIQRKLRGIIKTYQNVKWWSLQMMIISMQERYLRRPLPIDLILSQQVYKVTPGKGHKKGHKHQ